MLETVTAALLMAAGIVCAFACGVIGSIPRSEWEHWGPGEKAKVPFFIIGAIALPILALVAAN